ncbi:hypothetical protein E2C01_045760 [Portunus trituberculatus]|uniref:Uncharacterized protein n=1 Tax=Portunus trituberculatus TaxID=210409 RepID=A0A5B7G5W4_PORTR|nr:hypothetical protein [Portunus trituberculatus]
MQVYSLSSSSCGEADVRGEAAVAAAANCSESAAGKLKSRKLVTGSGCLQFANPAPAMHTPLPPLAMEEAACIAFKCELRST